MKPYYEHADITIYHGDCREVLPHLPKMDILLCDPPYGISYDASHKKYKNGIDRGDAAWDTEPFDPAHLIALNMPTIMWGGHCFSSRLPDASSWIVWVKIARQDANIRQSDCELAWTNCLGRSRVFQHLWIGAYRESESGIQNYHPTQKPLALMRWCIGLFPKVASVLDPYCGSGTTLVAAKAMGLTAIGIEQHEPYCEIAAKRLSQEVFDFQPAEAREIATEVLFKSRGSDASAKVEL
jgi:site-specific DNA-methyltransferase (adenine-specific)/modification methylase